MKQRFIILIALTMASVAIASAEKIDRQALVSRNNPQVHDIDSLSSLTVGNGEFAYTVDATGMQSFPARYSKGVPLGTQSQWGWHSFPNPDNLKFEETLKSYDFRHGHRELYATKINDNPRSLAAYDWYRENPHRLHLGIIGFDFGNNVKPADISNIHQTLNLWQGTINSHFSLGKNSYDVATTCHPDLDMIAVKIYATAHTPIAFRFAYPTGGHSDDACDWQKEELHATTIVESDDRHVVLKRELDTTTYFITVRWQGDAVFSAKGKHHFTLTPKDNLFCFTAHFTNEKPQTTKQPDYQATAEAAAAHWKRFWNSGAAVDFSHCTDPRARELERRVVLSQYLLAIQSAGSLPPQETGLTYNSWFGKYHLEMIYWHQAWQPLWNHADLLARTLKWYHKAEPVAKEIAMRQGFKGIRWMKMTDPSAIEAPSNVGSFLIWQQPHLIHLAELVYRTQPSQAFLEEYYPLVEQTAEFMADFATYDKKNRRYTLRGFIPAQETLKADETVNAPFELSYWHFALSLAQQWRERMQQPRNKQWDKIINLLSPLTYNSDKLYLAAETAPDTYKDIRFTSDHMAVLGAIGILPKCRLVENEYMQHTLDWVWENWNWNKTWGWDYPMTAMCAARLGDREKAVGALLMNNRTNTYLVSGHNYQDDRLRLYLPGNGGLLTAIALMCAGWDGCSDHNPGFPDDGTWDVRWEGLHRLP
ncbi:MAG: hypothetical protein IJ562_04845 [Prevotella sp.]|nr:hypothetical protein [Prevotella sp.]